MKLRLRAAIVQPQMLSAVEDKLVPESSKRNTYLETVLSGPPTEQVSFKPFKLPTLPKVEEPKSKSPAPTLSMPTLPTLNDFCGTTFSIDCNHCGGSVSNEHYHCSKCEMGDFDLCPACINRGITCDGDDHWLIKRTINDGRVVSSNTATLPPKKKTMPPPIPVVEEEAPIYEEDQRTCNSCIIRKSSRSSFKHNTNVLELGASSFVTCQQCADYDLCFFCLEHGEHGHHPAHTFTPVDASATAVTSHIKNLCQQGRGVKHEAMCDGCDAPIMGVRHKCLSCPDFDYCSMCFSIANEVHLGHRFAPIYEQLGPVSAKKEQHRGIYCDGPICATRARKSYIRGDRYKCAICHDTDFCANCEAFPLNEHDKSHPLIKLRSAVRYLSVASINELDQQPPVVLGDQQAKNASTETSRPASSNAATQVQTIAETTPVEKVEPEVVEKPFYEAGEAKSTHDLQAWFESDSTPDGSSFPPSRQVRQSWTLRNPGPTAWPVGCAVHFIGGDDMRNLDDKHPSSISVMAAANVSTALEAPLEVGKTATFSVILKSPAREGRAISYWRLKTPDGRPFGHKLWCDITITAKPVEAPTHDDFCAKINQELEAMNSKEIKNIPVEADDKSPASSQMIFPTLEKESPESSVHDIKDNGVAVEPSIAATEDRELLSDLDDMTLEDDDTEDGFMTDEEYDILDAEDEAYLASAEIATRK